MLNKLAIVALALPLVFNSGEAYPQPASKTDKGHQPTASAAPTAPKQGDSPTLQRDSNPPHDENGPKTIWILSAPKDEYDWIAWGANLLLVGVGIGGIAVAVCTLLILKKQTTATESSAIAALKQANHMVASERAWLVLAPDKFDLQESERLFWKITNRGRSVARVIDVGIRCRILTALGKLLEEYPDYGTAGQPISFYDVPLAPNESIPVFSPIEHEEGRYVLKLSQENIDDIGTGKSELVAYGYVRYRDYAGNLRESRSSFYYVGKFSSFSINLRAPAEYHKCT